MAFFWIGGQITFPLEKRNFFATFVSLNTRLQMKKILALFSAILLSALMLNAQQYNVLDIVKADARKARGMEGPHRLDEFGQMSKAPAGYKPFYISHYGRHGSRYAWNSKTYTLIKEVFDKAREKNLLTPYGAEFAEKYDAFYKVPYINAGDLVPMGYDQHLAIGTFTYEQFPQVFKGRKKVDALSSTGQRCIVSMGAFTLGLKSGNPKLCMRLRSDHVGMGIIAPPSAPKDILRHFKGEEDKVSLEGVEEFFIRTSGYQEVLDKLFTDSSFLEKFKGGATKFLSELWSLYCGYHNYEPSPLFDDLLTQEQVLKFWEADNYLSCISDVTSRYATIPLLEDIIGKAEDSFEDPNRAAHLRFGHDYILEGLVTLLNINNLGTIPEKAEDAKYWFQNYNIPMAATLLFVFYKNKAGDILFKLVLNENEATLPDLTPVSGNYYRWSDFRAYAAKIMEEHPEIKKL